MKRNPLLYQVGGYAQTQLTNPEFIQTYQGTPLEQAQQYGNKQAQDYQQNIQDLTKLDILNSQREVLPGDEAESEKYNQQLKSQFEDMAKKGDYENMNHQVNELARRHFNNKALKAMAESHKNFEEEDKLAKEMLLRGRTPLFKGQRETHKTVSVNPETGKQEFNVYRSKLEDQLDYDKMKSTIWDDIKPDAGYTTSALRANLPSLYGYHTIQDWKGISGGYDKNGKAVGKIGQQFANAMRRYMDTPEYSQEVRKLEHEENLTKEFAEEHVQKNMLANGMMRTFGDTSARFIDELESNGNKGLDIEALPAVNVKNHLGYTTDKFDPMSEYSKTTNQTYNPFQPNISNMASAWAWKPKDPEQNEDEKLAYTAGALAGARIFGQPGEAEQLLQSQDKDSTLAYAKQYQDFVHNRLVFPHSYSYTMDADPTLVERRSESLRNNIRGRQVWDLSTGQLVKTDEGGKINPQFMDLIGGNLNNMITTGSLSPKNPYYSITQNDKFADGEIVQVRAKTSNGNTEVRDLLVTKPEGWYNTPQGRKNQLMNVLWDKLALTPGQNQKFNVNGISIEATDIPDPRDYEGKSDKIIVYKFGEHSYPEGLPIEGGIDKLVQLIELSKAN